MTLTPAVRRIAVTLGLTISVLAAAGTIMAASRWTDGQAPLAVAPVSLESVQDALAQERQRSAALEAQLASIEGASTDLASALAAAKAQLAADATTAEDLRTSLQAAQDRLAKVEKALRAAEHARTAVVVTSRSTTTSSGSTRTSDDGERDDD
jgi:chromosome segregation ATPase